MDPALAYGWLYNSIAYDSLIYFAGNGELVPALATEWRFADDTNTVFEMDIRDGVKFSDGSELTGEAVVNSIKYWMETGGPMTGQGAAITDVKAVGPMTVQVTFATPEPNAANLMTQFSSAGEIISPKGLENPQALLTQTFGAGPYIYDGSASVPNDTYVYTKNPNYWNPEAQLYEKMVVKVITDPNQMLASLKTGQIDAGILGNPTLVPIAEGDGMDVLTVPYNTWNLFLADRDGTAAPPIANPLVRQAIGYAIDRDTLAKTVGGGLTPTAGQPLQPDTEGYVDGIDFTYDPERAKKLLTEAGYPNGFTFPMISSSLTDPNATLAQAVVGQLAKVGITAELKVTSTSDEQFNEEVQTQNYAAVLEQNFPHNLPDMMSVLMPPEGSPNAQNPENTIDPQLRDLTLKAYATGDDAERLKLYEQIERRVQELAWAIPLFVSPLILVSNPEKVTNVTLSPMNQHVTPVAPDAALAWKPASSDADAS